MYDILFITCLMNAHFSNQRSGTMKCHTGLQPHRTLGKIIARWIPMGVRMCGIFTYRQRRFGCIEISR